jgi:1-acyl-sn-glycerol-3-phosphate acyltransferase
LSKAEIKKIPIIGFAMELAGHVFLKRDDLQSTLQCTELTVKRLLDRNSMVLFAEGTRSNDGRLLPFKKGAFQMAKQAGVKVVPVSIGNLHRWMPKTALLPLSPIRDVYIKIHPAIETVDRPVTKIRAECFAAVNDGLPDYQRAVAAEKTPSE